MKKKSQTICQTAKLLIKSELKYPKSVRKRTLRSLANEVFVFAGDIPNGEGCGYLSLNWAPTSGT